MKRNKWAYKQRILNGNRGVDHTSLEYYHKWLVDLSIQKNASSLQENLSTPSKYEVYCESKTFGIIKLKEISYEWISSKEIIDFFRYFDFADKVSLYTDRNFYVDDNSMFSFVLSQKKYEIPVHLFWECLPQEVKNKFKLNKSHYKNIQALLTAYGRKISK